MIDFLLWLLTTGALVGVGLTLAYRRIELPAATLVLGLALLVYLVLGLAFGILHWLWILFLLLVYAGIVMLNSVAFRREKITLPMLRFYRTVVPQISDTEREALEAGNVWWDGELFSGDPDWSKLMALPEARLTAEEQAFLDGPVETLCSMLDDWHINHELADMPPETWEYIRAERFFAMIIPKRYGGLELSPLAVATVLAKLSSRCPVAASTVGVPNSLGPAELLLHYGTEEQKDRWLPGLARGEEIPCFALTGPRVGSDAAALPDTGVVCRRMIDGEEVLGLRLDFDKRYITLAPVATLIGLAFRMLDPDGLLGERKDLGITAALLPADTPGVEIGRRHLPLHTPFQNGPIRGRDVFIPLDAIIGGPERAGQGWKMLVELLSAGRAIVLPASAMGGGRAAVHASGAYTRIRRQFNLPVCEFDGVGEALARMAGQTYIINAALSVTATAIGRGEKPSVPSAILKYHCTEYGRSIANDAMDVHGGKAIMLGPGNYLASGYTGVPISITVEGANILTRSLIIFGQGAIRAHPFVLKEMAAAQDEDFDRSLRDFDRLLFGHIGFAISNASRAFVMALTHARYSDVPVDGPVARYYQHVNRYSAAFALAADVAMLTLGGELKRRELLSARLGDVFSSIYLASMVLKHYADQGQPEDDLPLVEWACRSLLYRAQEQLHGLLRNFPNRAAAAALRMLVFPRGRSYSAPGDDLTRQIVQLVTRPTPTRERLTSGIHAPREPGSPLGMLQAALEMAERCTPLEARLREAVRAGLVAATPNLPELATRAEEKGVLTAEEASQLRDFDAAAMELIHVDDFDPAELVRTPAAESRAAAS
ncbi:MAG: acyl-CoA dehydrogenase [Chromatiales bacterium]|nr:acyl-CoA dehydrogenase [Chromatiales bacterium]